ncbi:ORF6N domain-containing protein [Clostridium botulinum]|uniref:ORF6N domain-containing protein n=1 Tax=Clostridium botulinum TaxID=1491 RepID=UPI000698F8BE|nr:ORF6N domain-containing protein [Clostridium botulinum]MCC5428176.1 ORF6N domain-containing protein [Clostridium botulinum]
MKKINLTIENGQPVTTEIKPVEIGGKRVLTTEQLAEIYQTDINNIQVNFKNHKGKFTEGKHFYLLQGEKLKEFKNHLNNIQLVGKRASSLYLWTERGANRHCKILDTDKAWDQFDNLEETYFRVKENKVEVNQLSPELQMFNNLFKALATTELEQKKLNVAVQETKEEVQAIRTVVEITPSKSWRSETNRLMTKICFKLKDYQKPKEEVYKALQERAGCDLKIRLKNMRARLALQGVTKSKLDELNYLDVIEQDKKLIEIYTAIVKDMAIKHGIKA